MEMDDDERHGKKIFFHKCMNKMKLVSIDFYCCR